MIAVFNYIIFLIGLIAYYKKPAVSPLYYTFWCTVLGYIIDCFIGIELVDSQALTTMAMNYIYLCSIAQIIRKRSIILKKERWLLLVAMVLYGYVTYLALSRGSGGAFIGLMRIYFTIVPLWIIIKTEKIPRKLYVNYIVYALSLELTLSMVQLVLDFGFPSFVERYDVANGALNLSGTLWRYNAFAENISLLALCLLAVCYKKETFKFTQGKLILLFLTLFMVLMSGSKNVFGALFISLCIISYATYFRKRKKLLMGIIAFFLLFGGAILSYLAAIDPEKLRMLDLMRFTSEDDYITSGSTLFISYGLLEELFSEPSALLKGLGHLYSGGYLDGFVNPEEYMWDSYLALFLCEVGVLGVFFWSLFLRDIYRARPDFLTAATLVFLLLVSITDAGIFEGFSAVFLLIVVKSSTFTVESKRQLVAKKVHSANPKVS